MMTGKQQNPFVVWKFFTLETNVFLDFNGPFPETKSSIAHTPTGASQFDSVTPLFD